MLATTTDPFAGIVDVERLLGEVDRYREGRESRVMEGVLYADIGEKEGMSIENTDVYSYIEEESDEEWEQALCKKVERG